MIIQWYAVELLGLAIWGLVCSLLLRKASRVSARLGLIFEGTGRLLIGLVVAMAIAAVVVFVANRSLGLWFAGVLNLGLAAFSAWLGSTIKAASRSSR